MSEIEKVVTLGGGTGHFTLLRGLNRARLSPEKTEKFSITAIPGTWDGGGSTGRLRVEEGTLPMGDYMQCLIALLEDEEQFVEAMILLTDRSSGHPLRNLLASQAEKSHHGVEGGIDGLRRLLRVTSEIVPVSLLDLELCAKTRYGEVINGEGPISAWKRQDSILKEQIDEIAKVYFNPRAIPNPRAITALREADLKVMAPGSPYTSILAHHQVPGIAEAFCDPRGKRVAVLNIMTTQGEDHHLGKASYWLKTLINFARNPNPIDYLIVNDNNIDPEIREKYRDEGQVPVEVDVDECNRIMPDLKIVSEKLVHYDEISDLLRHNQIALAKTILQLR